MERPMQSSDTPSISSTLDRFHQHRQRAIEWGRDTLLLDAQREFQFNRALNMLNGMPETSYGSSTKPSATPHRETLPKSLAIKDDESVLVKLVEIIHHERDPEGHTSTHVPIAVRIEYVEAGVGDDGYASTMLYEIKPSKVRSFDYDRPQNETDNTREWEILEEATAYLDAIQTTL